MDQLPYLKEIADALKKIAGGSGEKTQNDALATIAKNIGASTIQETHVNMAGNANTKDIGEKLDKGLLVSVQDGSTAVIKSVVTVLKEALVEAFRECLTVEVTENNNTVRKGVAQLLTELVSHQENIEKALDGTNASGVARRIYNMITPLNNIKGAIDDGADDVVTAIGGVTVTVNVDSQDIADGIDASKISDIASDIHDIYNGNTGNVADIADAVSSIDQKTPTPTP